MREPESPDRDIAVFLATLPDAQADTAQNAFAAAGWTLKDVLSANEMELSSLGLPPSVRACAARSVRQYSYLLHEVFEGHVQTFMREAITADMLGEVQESDVAALGVESVGDRKRIFRHISQLSKGIEGASDCDCVGTYQTSDDSDAGCSFRDERRPTKPRASTSMHDELPLTRALPPPAAIVTAISSLGILVALQLWLAATRWSLTSGDETFMSLAEKARTIDLLAGIAGMATLAAAIATGVFLYRVCAYINPRLRDIEPGPAVFLLLIPIFNLYWVFRSFRGISRGLSKQASKVRCFEVPGTSRPDFITMVLALAMGGSFGICFGLFSAESINYLIYLQVAQDILAAICIVLFILWLLGMNSLVKGIRLNAICAARRQRTTASIHGQGGPPPTIQGVRA
ncbi:MAG: SAM domain-containing protein [Planctomycetota bacterium]